MQIKNTLFRILYAIRFHIKRVLFQFLKATVPLENGFKMYPDSLHGNFLIFFFYRCHVFLWIYFITILWVSSNGKSSFYIIPIVFQTKEIRFLNYWRSATSPSKHTVLTHRPSAKNFVKGYGNRTFLIWPMGFFSLNKASSVLKATAFMKVLVKIFHTHGLRDSFLLFFNILNNANRFQVYSWEWNAWVNYNPNCYCAFPQLHFDTFNCLSHAYFSH